MMMVANHWLVGDPCTACASSMQCSSVFYIHTRSIDHPETNTLLPSMPKAPRQLVGDHCLGGTVHFHQPQAARGNNNTRNDRWKDGWKDGWKDCKGAAAGLRHLKSAAYTLDATRPPPSLPFPFPALWSPPYSKPARSSLLPARWDVRCHCDQSSVRRFSRLPSPVWLVQDSHYIVVPRVPDRVRPFPASLSSSLSLPVRLRRASCPLNRR